MKQNRDAGTSSAAAFLMILAVILVCAGVFAAAVLPAEETREAEQQADAAKTTLSETVFLMRGAAESAETRGLEFSVLFPKGTLTAEPQGYLQIEGRTIPLCSVCLEAGKTRTKVIRISYLDRENGIVLVMGTDITRDREERKHALSIALSRITTIHEFYYYLKENRCELPQRTMRKYNCKKVYTDMPHSFMKDFVYEEDWDNFEEMYNQIRNHERKTAKCVFRNKKGDVWVKQTLSVVPADGKQSNVVVGILEDITEQKKMEFRAERDQLTGLYNKVSALSNIQNIMKRYKNQTHVMFVFDLDNFKQINDLYGHSVGDDVLVKMSTLLRSYFRSDDIVARFGGDEFIVFVPCVKDKRVVLAKADLIIEAVRDEISARYNMAQVSTSIGIAYSDMGSSVSSIFEQADKALYEAKQNGKDRCCVANSHSRLKQSVRETVKI